MNSAAVARMITGTALTALSYRKLHQSSTTHDNSKANRHASLRMTEKRPARLRRSHGADGLRAMRTAMGINRNLAQALGALFRRWISRRWRFAHARNQHVHWRDHEEIDGRRDQQERNSSIDEVTNREVRAADGKSQVRKIGLTDNGGNKRSQQVLSKSRDYRGESRAHDHADCHIHNIAAQNELLESTEHKHLQGSPDRVVRRDYAVNRGVRDVEVPSCRKERDKGGAT